MYSITIELTKENLIIFFAFAFICYNIYTVVTTAINDAKNHFTTMKNITNSLVYIVDNEYTRRQKEEKNQEINNVVA